MTAWDALMAPAGTPKAVIEKLHQAVTRAMAMPALQADLLKRGARAAPTSPAELSDFIKSQFVSWGDAVRASGAKIE